MIRLAYTSVAQGRVTAQTLNDILLTARLRNWQDETTGLLLYKDHEFLQILEGEEAKVDDLLERLNKDPRHTGLSVFCRHSIRERIFADWSMGCIDPAALEPEWLMLLKVGQLSARSI